MCMSGVKNTIHGKSVETDLFCVPGPLHYRPRPTMFKTI